MRLETYADADMQAMDVANVLASELRTALSSRDEVLFAVPGGTTPGPVFDALCCVPLEWSRVHVILSDERWVPESNAQSNAALVRKRLLQGHAAEAKFTPFYADDCTIEEAAARLSDSLSAHLPIAVLLLGMGADMHTASLFPKADGLAEAMEPGAQMFHAVSVPGHDIRRLSLSADALRGAVSTHLLIKGDDKRAALETAQTSDDADAPVRVALADATVHWTAS
ncbi:6-phosphogluconolactonase [Sulfitobacter sp. S190]|uniref:6-phosphogluconolactonase n=1 Tax=Sulfitobacter sp. S190 TaxID=2867022 RepID=UPI0021A78274|nr:6-phosphogluconolactonase [Sulfitobacter sp. S190]UWR24002.1 6-phosphogluconolactonase [Sulfitobacter sp. S190]